MLIDDIIDFEPNLGFETNEHPLYMLVYFHYKQHFNEAQAKDITTDYFQQLKDNFKGKL